MDAGRSDTSLRLMWVVAILCGLYVGMGAESDETTGESGHGKRRLNLQVAALLGCCRDPWQRWHSRGRGFDSLRLHFTIRWVWYSTSLRLATEG